jgi:hypothetical protein
VSIHFPQGPPTSIGPGARVPTARASERIERAPDDLALPRPVLDPPTRPPRG